MIRSLPVVLFWGIALVGGAWSAPAGAHEVVHRVAREGSAVVVTLEYAEGTPFNYESVEIFRPGEEIPFQVAHTDARGRLAFIPDAAGTWRLRAFSEDGHGADFTIEADASGAVTASGDGLMNRFPRLIGGLAILLGAFGLMSLFYGRGKG